VSTWLSARRLMPSLRDVLAAQGVPRAAPVSTRLERLVEEALMLLSESAEPRGLFEPISAEDLAVVLDGRGANAHDAVVGWIYPRADALALFAATLGARITSEIEDLFAADRVALAVSLDAAASCMAENAGTEIAARFKRRIHETKSNGDDLHVLGYSPGYCGWHVSGQHALFAHLRPGRIGITLSDTSLMDPIKSVSGVLVAGPAALHAIEPGFSYCASCRDHTCTVRVRSLLPDPRTSQTSSEGAYDA